MTKIVSNCPTIYVRNTQKLQKICATCMGFSKTGQDDIMQTMIKEIQLLGVTLENYTVREAITKFEGMMHEEGVRIIEEVTMETMANIEDESVKAIIKQANLTVIADYGILVAAKEKNMQRRFEIDNNEFFYELVKRLERNNESVFIIGENEKQTGETVSFLMEEFPKLEIVKTINMDEIIGAEDAIVNEINVHAPKAVLSLLKTPMQEKFLNEHKDKISSMLWYNVSNSKKVKRSIKNTVQKGLRMLHIRRQLVSEGNAKVSDEPVANEMESIKY